MHRACCGPGDLARVDVELGDHLLGDVQQDRRGGDHHRVEAGIGRHPHRRRRPALLLLHLQVPQPRPCRQPVDVDGVLVGQQLGNDRGDIVRPSVFEKDGAHLELIGGQGPVERRDDCLDPIELLGGRGDHHRVARGLGGDDRRVVVGFDPGLGGRRRADGLGHLGGIGLGQMKDAHVDHAHRRPGVIELQDQRLRHGHDRLRRRDDQRVRPGLGGDAQEGLGVRARLRHLLGDPLGQDLSQHRHQRLGPGVGEPEEAQGRRGSGPPRVEVGEDLLYAVEDVRRTGNHQAAADRLGGDGRGRGAAFAAGGVQGAG